MKNQGLGIRNWGLAITIMLVASQSSFAGDRKAQEGDEDLRITVRVYDYAQVPEEILSASEKEAAHILANAGIRTVWLKCSAGQAEGQSNAACERAFGPNELMMRIVPAAMAAKLPFRDITLGFAALTEEGGQGFLGGVFYHKVERMARETGMDRYQILAHAMAHEIGHLLLRTLKHASSGLMCALWGPEELELARRGLLPFTPKEAARLRAEVLARSNRTSALAAAASETP